MSLPILKWLNGKVDRNDMLERPIQKNSSLRKLQNTEKKIFHITHLERYRRATRFEFMTSISIAYTMAYSYNYSN